MRAIAITATDKNERQQALEVLTGLFPRHTRFLPMGGAPVQMGFPTTMRKPRSRCYENKVLMRIFVPGSVERTKAS